MSVTLFRRTKTSLAQVILKRGQMEQLHSSKTAQKIEYSYWKIHPNENRLMNLVRLDQPAELVPFWLKFIPAEMVTSWLLAG
jgi:hypothetical protein